jgi:hypothetical protein
MNGYRFLSCGEIVISSDEVSSADTSRWYKTLYYGHTAPNPYTSKLIYRRKVNGWVEKDCEDVRGNNDK